MANGIGWDYEESANGYYHIYASCGPLEGRFDAITIGIQETPENNMDIQLIAEALDRIASRITDNA